MLLDILKSGDFSITTILPWIISSIIIIFFTLPMHEWAHAFVATKLGDPTPGYQGRLTINPFAHIDYFGALMLLFLGIGWARPVQINSRYFNNIKRDIALTAAAGPIMNLLLAFVFMIISNIYMLIFSEPIYAAYYSGDVSIPLVIYYIFQYYISINVSLAIFNLIPVPPFDGSKILFAFLPPRAYLKVMEYERYFRIIVLVLIFSSVGSGILSTVTGYVLDGLWFLANLPFNLILG